jgi:hypothetical protein
MKKQFNLIIATALALLTGACQEEYKAPTSATVAMSGKWWYELSLDANQDGIFNEDDGDEKFITYADYGAADLLTSNTNANDADSILITDQIAPGFGQWPFTFHAPVDLASLTLKPATGLYNFANEDAAVTVIEGKILKNAATTLSGGKADSIYIRLEFADDEGSHYMFTGHRDTGFPEDQY